MARFPLPGTIDSRFQGGSVSRSKADSTGVWHRGPCDKIQFALAVRFSAQIIRQTSAAGSSLIFGLIPSPAFSENVWPMGVGLCVCFRIHLLGVPQRETTPLMGSYVETHPYHNFCHGNPWGDSASASCGQQHMGS